MINANNPNHIYLSDETLETLARAGVQEFRIEEMRAARDAAVWVTA